MHTSLDEGTPKPDRLFDRDTEWKGLVSFAADDHPGATLGVVSGRRRQGKSYLLQALATALGGIYFPALELTEAVTLRLFADELIRFSGSPVPPFRDWLDAVPYLFRLTGDRSIPVVIDEFPFLVKASPALPSIIQRELGPGGAGSASRARLLLCGSAMSGWAACFPDRRRCGDGQVSELVVHPFGYRDAARFWGISDPKLAVLVHSLVGGTPAYRRELVREDTPADLDDFDACRRPDRAEIRRPRSSREARYLPGRGDRDTRPVAVPFGAGRRRRGRQHLVAGSPARYRAVTGNPDGCVIRSACSRIRRSRPPAPDLRSPCPAPR